MKKILTILVPVYNTEKYIKRCLDSILLKEVLNDIEILVVSDGSKDNSVNIVKEYQKKYPKTVILVEKENGGHGSTINKGIELATGKYFKVLDSDDWFNSLDFVKFVKKLKKTDVDLVVTNYSQQHVYESREVTYIYKNLEENKIYNFNKFNLDELCGEYFVMATSTYKLDLLKKSNVNLYEKTFYVDMQYNVQCIMKVETFEYFDLDLYRYYIGRKDQSVNVNSFVKNKLHHEKVMKYLIEFYENNKKNMSNNRKKYISQIIVYMLYTHYTIFCKYDNNYIEAYKQIKDFDKYLEKESIELYERMNTMRLIYGHRKTKFIFVKRQTYFLQKIFNLLVNK